MADKMQIEILEDGTISVQTDAISGKNHHSADEFLAMIEELGGKRSTQKLRKSHKHKHLAPHSH